MVLSHFITKKRLVSLRRLMTGLMLLLILLLLAGMKQKASAANFLDDLVTETPTVTYSVGVATEVNHEIVLPTDTAEATLTPTPTATSIAVRAVIINEVAWSGTRSNTQQEWIELYNPGNFDINLEGWILRFDRISLNLGLHGTIPKKGYFLLARKLNQEDITGPFSDISLDETHLYMSDLIPDTGDYLVLYSPNGMRVDFANAQNSTWIAGSIYPACSMERVGLDQTDGSFWVTNNGSHANGTDLKGLAICGSPGQPNWNVLPTPSKTPTKTITPYPPYRTMTPTRTPKHSPTPTRNPYATPPPYVYLNEFLSQPRFDWNGDGKINTGDEFIELVNLGKSTVLLTGWTLDDQDGDSPPYKIDSVSIEAQGHVTFFTSKTGILLSTGGDSVRLYKPNGIIADAFTYNTIAIPNQSWCRMQDGNGLWMFGCEPTINGANKKAQTAIVGKKSEPVICINNALPFLIRQAECDSVGLDAWNPLLWALHSVFPRFIEDGTSVYILE